MKLPSSEWPKMPCDLRQVNDEEFDQLLRSFSDADSDDRSILKPEAEGEEISVNSAVISTERKEAADHVVFQIARKASSWKSLVARIAYLRRFISYLGGKRDFEKGIRGGETLRAMRFIFAALQRSLGPEYESLSSNGQVKKSSRLARLNPFLDMESHPPIIRVGGRIYRRGGDNNHPVILPREKEIVPLLIRHKHDILGHGGIEHTRAELRERVWILQDKRAVKSVVNNCVICRRHFGKPLSQQMAPLPEARVVATQAWSVTGVDLAGPFHVSVARSRP